MIPWNTFETPLDAYKWAKENAHRLVIRQGWYTRGVHLIGERNERNSTIGFFDWIGKDGRRV